MFDSRLCHGGTFRALASLFQRPGWSARCRGASAGHLIARIRSRTRHQSGATMLRYAISRAILFIPTLLGMTAFTFLIMQLTPGSPFSPSAANGITPEMIHDLEAKYGLDKPIYERFGLYLWHSLHRRFRRLVRIPPADRDRSHRPVVADLVVSWLDGGDVRDRRRDDAGHPRRGQSKRHHRLHLRDPRDPLLQHAEFRDGIPADPGLRGLAARRTAFIPDCGSTDGRGRKTGSCRPSRWERRRSRL